jgi:endonuclease-8
MPEGDTVHKLARALRPLLEGESLESLWIRDRGEVRELAGRRIEEVAALGKHMLVAIGPEVALHVHLGLHGRWHRYRSGEPWQRGAASLHLETKAWSFVCFHARWAELLRRGELGTHPALGRLGPDLLAEEVDFAEVLERARRRDPARAGDLLLDQSVACGLGNVFKNEVLFLEGVHPSASPRALGAERLLALFRRGRELLRRNLGGWPRTTTREVEPGSPWPRDLPRLFVYERTGRPCLRCGAAVEFFRQGDFASPTYFCPACQPASGTLERSVEA